MANSEHVEIVKRGADAIQEWREENPDAPLNLSEADLREANLRGANLFEASLAGANLSRADLSAADLDGADLRGANLHGANLHGANLGGADLQKANLSGANLCEADLHMAHVSDGHLRGANLRGANFMWATLSGADLDGAHVRHANLCETLLCGATLRTADLSHSRLQGASLSGANLRDANLHGADLREANFHGAHIGATEFDDVDLSVAKGLEAVHHTGPSTVGVDTLFKSQGKIPEAFLRGCGVPDELIAGLPSLLGSQQAVQLCSCFISYSQGDEDFARRLYSRMREERLRVWYAPENLKGGRRIPEQIDEAIRVHDKLLLVLSEHSMAGPWLATEVYHARQRETREGKRILFPMGLIPPEDIRQWECLDADTGQDLGREIREYSIPDFSNWQDHNAFEAAFKRLLEDLNAEAARAPLRRAPGG